MKSDSRDKEGQRFACRYEIELCRF